MRRVGTKTIAALAALLLAARTAGGTALDAALDSALARTDLTREAVRLTPDYEPADRWRLRCVSRALDHPFTLAPLGDGWAASIEAACPHGLAPLAAAAMAPLDLPIREAVARDVAEARSWKDLASAVHCASMRVETLLGGAWSAVPPESLVWLRSHAFEILDEDPDDAQKSLFDLERDRERAEARADRVMRLLRRVDLGKILEAARLGAAAAEGVETAARRIALQPEGARWGRRGDRAVLASGEHPGLRWAIGGPGPNERPPGIDLWIDTGGDDTASADAGGGPLRITVDLGGNDRHLSRENACLGGAAFRVDVLIDASGDDLYRSGACSQGAGFCGAGILVDRAGNDQYIADRFSQGAGFCGAGVLWDREGMDRYGVALQGEGFGGPGGVGLLLDERGNDTYAADGRYTDVLRYQDHQLSLSQGFGYGLRPDDSGGAGLLLDLAGHDRYLGDIYCQGVSYWYALGALIDRGGNDLYSGFQYTQGAGIHVSLGLLLDGEGQDRYLAKGVAQGCGHDLGLGWLEDRAGADVYVAYDLAQGAGSANGIGVVCDGAGDDQYMTGAAANTQGYGNPRRGSGSLGLLVDAGGKDAYIAGEAQNEEARVGSRAGSRFDLNGPGSEEPPWAQEPAAPLPDRAFTVKELFWMASAGEPKFRDFQKLGFERLARGGDAALALLRAKVGERDARDRKTASDLLAKIGSPALPLLQDSLRAGGLRARSFCAMTLGLIRDGTALPDLTVSLRDPAWQVRAAAAEAIGKCGGAASLGALERLLTEDPAPWARKAALVALYSLEPHRVAEWIRVGERDPSIWVKLAAREIAGSRGPQAGAPH